jgi:hypothetical protein
VIPKWYQGRRATLGMAALAVVLLLLATLQGCALTEKILETKTKAPFQAYTVPQLIDMCKQYLTCEGDSPTPVPVPPAPGPPPPVNPAPATDAGTGADELDLHAVTWLHPSVADYQETAILDNVRISGKVITWDWVQPGWPITYPANGVLGNMWVLAKTDGHWYAATWEWLRANTARSALEAKGDQAPFIQTKRHPIDTWKPQRGEKVGFMASTAVRENRRGPAERSNVYWVLWP